MGFLHRTSAGFVLGRFSWWLPESVLSDAVCLPHGADPRLQVAQLIGHLIGNIVVFNLLSEVI